MNISVHNSNDLAALIDHTILKAFAADYEIQAICDEAIQYHFASVCVNSCHVSAVHKSLAGSSVKTCAVIGFPLGADATKIKQDSASWCVNNGADEIDMVLNIGFLKSGRIKDVEADINSVVKGSGNALVKVILECCYLTKDEIRMACRLAESAGAHFVKTSTGFGSGGAIVEDVLLMAHTVPSLKVKASGGIRDLKTALSMIEAGASRLGLSAGVSIMKELEGGNADLSSGY